MKFYDKLTQENLCQEIDDICNSDYNSYPFERKAARLNSSLDFYFQLAWKANRARALDDTNNSAIPLEEKDIATGVNSFKMSDFTKKFVGLMKITALNSDATPIELVQEFFNNLPDEFDTLYGTYGKANDTGTPQYYCILGDYIYLRPTPDYSETDGLKVYGNLASSKFAYKRCTISQATPGVVTSVEAHGLSVNDTVLLRTTDTLPTGLSADTLYYVKTVSSTTTFTLASTQGGTAINTTGAGSGEHAFLQANKTPGIPPLYDHYMYLARKASLPYLSDKGKNNVKDVRSLILEDEAKIFDYFANKDIDVDNKMTFKQRAYK